ncbi:hypothetical protein [Pseudomonas sp. GCEP-101]|uniref:hypothetical protein n=1 Tax=Pseudomonas sp. GCEP-101 TaxID=2974552 RepID=UPI00223B5BE3|nr:hypothetical protein [Pseudomonas sp. GCEP-101]
MGIEKGEVFAQRDIYIDYDFEDVTYRWDHRTSTVYVRFYGEPEHPEPVPQDNPLFNDALRFGREISREEYLRGFPAP